MNVADFIELKIRGFTDTGVDIRIRVLLPPGVVGRVGVGVVVVGFTATLALGAPPLLLRTAGETPRVRCDVATLVAVDGNSSCC